MERTDSYWGSTEDLSLQFFMGSTSSQPEFQPPALSQPQKPWEPIRLCGTVPTTVVPAERYVEQLWAALDQNQTLLHSNCGVGSDTPVGQGGTLNMDNYTIVGAPAPVKQKTIPMPPGVPPPPEYLPEMKDEAIVKNTIKAVESADRPSSHSLPRSTQGSTNIGHHQNQTTIWHCPQYSSTFPGFGREIQ